MARNSKTEVCIDFQNALKIGCTVVVELPYRMADHFGAVSAQSTMQPLATWESERQGRQRQMYGKIKVANISEFLTAFRAIQAKRLLGKAYVACDGHVTAMRNVLGLDDEQAKFLDRHLRDPNQRGGRALSVKPKRVIGFLHIFEKNNVLVAAYPYVKYDVDGLQLLEVDRYRPLRAPVQQELKFVA